MPNQEVLSAKVLSAEHSALSTQHSTLNQDWPDYRRDLQLSGGSPLGGSSSDLKLLATTGIGGGYQEVFAIPDQSHDLLLASGGGIQRISLDGEYRWKSKPFGAHWITGVWDLDGDGELEILTSNGREVLILSARTGEILWREIVALPRSYGTYGTMIQVHKLIPTAKGMQFVVPCFSTKEVLVYDCSNGARETILLHELWMDDAYHPTICIGDVDNDGEDEIVIARLGGVYVFRGSTGEILTETQWESDTERRRNYGHFELVDLDDDGDLEAVILSNRVSRHIAVLDNNSKGNFTPLWDRFIEHIYPLDTTELRYVANSVCSGSGFRVPGSGNQIAVSIYNTRGDERWYTEIIDAQTGRTTNEIADRYLWGVAEIGYPAPDTGHRTPLLFLSDELTRVPSTRSRISASTFDCQELWSADNAAFCARTVHSTSLKSQFKPEIFGNDDVWFDDCFYYHSKSNEINRVSLDSLTRISRTPDPGPRIPTQTIECAPPGSRIASIDPFVISYPDGRLKIVRDEGNTLIETGTHLTTESHISARPGAVATVGSGVIAVAQSGKIRAFGLENKSLTKLWHLPGRSRLGYDGVFHAPSIIDGDKIVVVDDEGLSHAQLSLYSLKGEQLRRYEFADVPASIPGSRVGIYDWLPFQHSQGAALFISYYASLSMNSEGSRAILLEDGSELWRVSQSGEGEYGRGIGPWGTASLLGASGTEDRTPDTGHQTPPSIAVFCAKDTLIMLDLESGIFHQQPKLLTDFTSDAMRAQGIYKEQGLSTWSTKDDPFTAYGSVIVKDVNGDGIDELCVAGCFGGMGVLTEDLDALWWHVTSFGDVLYRMPGIADFDGDGQLEWAQSHSTGDVRLYDAQTGELKCGLQLHAIATDIVTADFDGDGKPEMIFGTNDGRLIAAKAENDQLRIVFEHQMDTGVGVPTVAEVDGKICILVVNGAGELCVFGE